MKNRKIVSKCSIPILKPGKDSLDSNKTFLSPKFQHKNAFFPFILASEVEPLCVFASVRLLEGFLQQEISQNDQKMQNRKSVSKCSIPILRPGKQSLDSNKTFLSPKFQRKNAFFPFILASEVGSLCVFASVRLLEGFLQ